MERITVQLFKDGERFAEVDMGNATQGNFYENELVWFAFLQFTQPFPYHLTLTLTRNKSKEEEGMEFHPKPPHYGKVIWRKDGIAANKTTG